MAVRLIDGSEFLHIPKTGGEWVTKILSENNLVKEFIGHKHADYDYNLFQPHKGGKELLNSLVDVTKKRVLNVESRAKPSSEIFRFCFVRHPLSWYESWWKYMRGRDWNHWGQINSSEEWHPNSILNDLGSDDFNEFVWNVVKKRPGYVSELLFSYTKMGISKIGKTENLREDLTEILGFLGLKFDPEKIFKRKEFNVSDHSEIEWDKKLAKTVMQLELPALIHYNYISREEREALGLKNEEGMHTSLISKECA